MRRIIGILFRFRDAPTYNDLLCMLVDSASTFIKPTYDVWTLAHDHTYHSYQIIISSLRSSVFSYLEWFCIPPPDCYSVEYLVSPLSSTTLAIEPNHHCITASPSACVATSTLTILDYGCRVQDPLQSDSSSYWSLVPKTSRPPYSTMLLYLLGRTKTGLTLSTNMTMRKRNQIRMRALGWNLMNGANTTCWCGWRIESRRPVSACWH
jgi:hypothetical protein